MGSREVDRPHRRGLRGGWCTRDRDHPRRRPCAAAHHGRLRRASRRGARTQSGSAPRSPSSARPPRCASPRRERQGFFAIGAGAGRAVGAPRRGWRHRDGARVQPADEDVAEAVDRHLARLRRSLRHPGHDHARRDRRHRLAFRVLPHPGRHPRRPHRLSADARGRATGGYATRSHSSSACSRSSTRAGEIAALF